MEDNKFYIKSIGRDNSAFLFWMLGSIAWVLGFPYINEHSIDLISSNLTRGYGMVITNLAFIYFPYPKDREYEGLEMDRQSLFFISVRHVILTVYGFGFAEAQFYLPSPVIYTIFFSGPLFIVSIDYLVFGIKITYKQTKGTIISFLGVILTSNGHLMSAWLNGNWEFQTQFQNYKTDSNLVKAAVAMGMIILTIFWAYSAIVTRRVRKATAAQSNFNFGLFLVIVATIGAQVTVQKESFDNNVPQFLRCLVYQGLILACCQNFFMHALLITKKIGTMTMVGFIGVIFSYFWSILRYGEQLNYICLLGTVLVIYGVSQIVLK